MKFAKIKFTKKDYDISSINYMQDLSGNLFNNNLYQIKKRLEI